MNLTKSAITLLSVITLLMTGCGAETGSPYNEFTEFVKKTNLLKSGKLRMTPIPGTDRSHIPSEAVDEYMRLFDRLQCTRDSAFILCYYHDDGLGGEPHLVASTTRTSPDDWMQTDDRSIYEWIEENDAKKFMVPKEDTPMAYFQYLFFQVYGEQFALYWHANYNRREILLEHPEKGRSSSREPLIDVALKEDQCIVTLYEENHEDISQVTFGIGRKAPWVITREDRVITEKPEVIY